MEYQEIIKKLQLSGAIEDGKAIVDAIPKVSQEELTQAFLEVDIEDKDSVLSFFDQYFSKVSNDDNPFQTNPNNNSSEHIKELWDVLKREKDVEKENSTLIALPFPYIVPGGRFNEIYYWDSFFTMQGLKHHDRIDIIENMIENFAWLIDQHGYIPNGNRNYFLGRSQPPFFHQMVLLLEELKGEGYLIKYTEQLRREYEFWMRGGKRRAVKLKKGFLNRYFDENSTPREEMYLDDVMLSQEVSFDHHQLYKDIRAACESGWDFSSRWFHDFKEMKKIRTTDLVPVDLNCLLYGLEQTLIKAYKLLGKTADQGLVSTLSQKRKELIQHYCWNASQGFYFDYDHKFEQSNLSWNLSGAYPLYFGIATQEQANQCAAHIESKFLMEGGLQTTTINSGQQWDAPNGWAPLQWMTVQGLLKYDHTELARDIMHRWTKLNEKVFENTGKFVEKYNVVDTSLDAGGGEYPVQDGFGWSNGVYIDFKHLLNLKQD